MNVRNIPLSYISVGLSTVYNGGCGCAGQGQVLSLVERKEELKEELAAMLEDRDHWKEKFRYLY